jgi:hypothetical protein
VGPNLCVIVTSGYFERGEMPFGENFMAKPWSVADLIAQIKQAL